MASTAVGSAVGGATSALTSLGKAGGNAVEAVLPDDLSALPTPDIDMQSLPPELRQTLRRNDITAQDIKLEVRQIYRDVISREEQRRIGNIAQRVIGDVASTPTDATQDIEDAIDRIIGEGGVISDQERAQLQDSLQERLGLSNREVQQLSNQIEDAAAEARADVEAALETAQTEAAQAAEQAADTVSAISGALFFASLLGLLAAGLGGKFGHPKTGLVADRFRLT